MICTYRGSSDWGTTVYRCMGCSTPLSRCSPMRATSTWQDNSSSERSCRPTDTNNDAVAARHWQGHIETLLVIGQNDETYHVRRYRSGQTRSYIKTTRDIRRGKQPGLSVYLPKRAFRDERRRALLLRTYSNAPAQTYLLKRTTVQRYLIKLPR